MLAILYLAGIIYFGDCISRYFYRFNSIGQRFATSFLVGLLLSSCITFLGSLAFAWSGQPLIMGNIILVCIVILAGVKLSRRSSSSYLESVIPRLPGYAIWDWLCLGACLIFGCWLMFETLGFQDGNFQFGFKSWSDFGANLSLSQSFVLGHNFPPEHPFYPGETLRYHFLFWFQAANFSFLGLNLVSSVNLLSILSLAALLILIMKFTELLFDSRVVSRIAVILFFFPSSSLSYIPFLLSQTSFRGAVDSILHATNFLSSGYNFRGETWGALSVAVFTNQRHLISGVGILFVVLVFLVDFYKHKKSLSKLKPASTENTDSLPEFNVEVLPGRNLKSGVSPSEDFRRDIQTVVFSGFLIGALPYWNSAVFVASLIILGSLLVFFPYRRYMLCLIGTAVLVGLPQVLILRSGNVAQTGQSLFQWGYTIENPTVLLVLQYLTWTFGFKWILLFIALYFLSNTHRRLFLALSSLVPVVFLLRLSTDAFNNHKLLNIWNVFAVIFVAYALWRIGKASVGRAVLAFVLALAMVFGAIVDLFPVKNDPKLVLPYEKDRLTTWLLDNTKPTDIFLTQNFLTHPILFTGRKIFMGNTLFAWTAGYNVGEREKLYQQMFDERDVNKLLRLLHRYNIAYVGIDDGVRGNNIIKDLNESVYKENFEKVYEDTEHRTGNITIYKVPVCDCDIKSQPAN